MKPILVLTVILLVTMVGPKLYATATLHCPPDQTLACTAQISNLMAYGDAYLLKDGIKYSAGLAYVTNELNTCNVGKITRKWQVEDVNGTLITCRQVLTFQAGNFSEDNIVWPETDLQLSGCETDLLPGALPQEYQAPTYYHGLCNRIGQSYKDTEYIFGSDCKKIVREWTLVDWCTYSPVTGQGSWKFYQVFKLSNNSDPELQCPAKTVVVAKACDSSYVNLPLATAVGESCTGGFTITNTSVHADTTSNDASGVYPVGDHIVRYEVDYACGSKNHCETYVSVIDPTPVPYCLATINVVLMGVDTDGDGTVDNGMVDIWAKDVNVGSYHPCHNLPLDFSFEQDSLVMSRSFTCQEVGRNNVNIYVSDPAGKQAYCRVQIDVQNNGANIPNCQPLVGSRPLISGLVTNPNGEAISGVFITHKDAAPITETTANGTTSYQNVNCEKTTADGSYSSDDLAIDRTYEVQAYKVGDVTRMNEADVAILEAYIKGESSFKSPYTYLAADLNEDGTVDIDDFHLMRNLVGADEAAWPNQKQWIFYTKRSVMNQDTDGRPTMPVHLHSSYNIELLGWGYGEDGDFIGILKGDLDYYEQLN